MSFFARDGIILLVKGKSFLRPKRKEVVPPVTESTPEVLEESLGEVLLDEPTEKTEEVVDMTPPEVVKIDKPQEIVNEEKPVQKRKYTRRKRR